MRRVVVTGMGLVSPLGFGLKTNWERLTASSSGIRAITHFDASDLACRIAGLIPRVAPETPNPPGAFNPGLHVPPKDQKKMDDFIIYGMAAADEAIMDSGWIPSTDEERERTGVTIGSGIGGLNSIYETSLTLKEKGPKRVSPFFIPMSLINLCSGQVSIKYGFTGPNHANVTACSTGAHSIGDAARMIVYGDADVMVAGGAESAVGRIGMAGFAALRALSTGFNDRPQKASRPYDRDRDGFVMGEGAGIVVLEELEHAKKRGARIYAELIGYGMSGDAYHMTAPPEDGNGGYRAMRNALKDAKISPEEVDYINAHGTSTPLGDEIELNAIRQLFGPAIENVSVSSTKSAIGHLLGAAGGVEAVYSILAAKNNLLPPTLNLDNPSENCGGVDLVPKKTREKNIRVTLSNSFGFGGTNACLIFREWE